MLAQERAASAEVDAFLEASDPLFSHPAYVRYELEQTERARAAAVAEERSGRTILDDLAEAEAGIAETLAAAREGG